MTNRLVDVAAAYQPRIVLRNEIFRVALDETHVSTLKQTARNVPMLCEWMDRDRLDSHLLQGNDNVLGALRMHGGCKVIDVPSYLKGLWQACQLVTAKTDAKTRTQWIVDEQCTSQNYNWKQRLANFDAVIFSAGAGLFEQLLPTKGLPIHLVRGQAIELELENDVTIDDAFLCGKYVSPLPERNRALIGTSFGGINGLAFSHQFLSHFIRLRCHA